MKIALHFLLFSLHFLQMGILFENQGKYWNKIPKDRNKNLALTGSVLCAGPARDPGYMKSRDHNAWTVFTDKMP